MPLKAYGHAADKIFTEGDVSAEFHPVLSHQRTLMVVSYEWGGLMQRPIIASVHLDVDGVWRFEPVDGFPPNRYDCRIEQAGDGEYSDVLVFSNFAEVQWVICCDKIARRKA